MKTHLLRPLLPFVAGITILAQVPYDRHVLFDNSLPDRSYFHSQGSVVAPSRLQLVNGRFPVASA